MIKKSNFIHRRFILLSIYICIVLFSIVSTITYSEFTNRNEVDVANIKVADMNYNLVINGKQSRIIYVPANDVTIASIIINSLNTVNSKYELIYGVCSVEDCTSLIETPENLFVEYSSRTTDPITDVIEASEFKQVRLGITNNTDNGYYLIFGINAGYIHNTLALENLIINEYNEEDVTIATIIYGEISTTFPTTGNYAATVECKTNKGESNATGTATWNGTKWIVNISGADSGKTVCNSYFNEPLLGNMILSQGGGISLIVAKGTPNFSVINGTSGLYAAEDEYGTSYYYRGLKDELNNNLIWGGFQWKIVRINGDGSVRLVYNGTEAQFNSAATVNKTGTNTQIGTSTFNSIYNDNKYVGYMYGGANGTASTQRNGSISTAATYNETSSTIKEVIDNWYSQKILGKSFESQVVNNLFCNDRQLQSEVGGSSTGSGYGTSETYYAAYYRTSETKTPTLTCSQQNDRFTTSADTTLGNGALTYPVGLLTADEAAMAGQVSGGANSTNYLSTGEAWWLLSPNYMNYYNTFEFRINDTLDRDYLGRAYGVRPSISIISTFLVSGLGSATDPFRAL